MYKLSFSRDAKHFLDELDAKQFRQVVKRILALTMDALPSDSQPLTGSHFRRVDQGEYRIIYAVEEDIVAIVLVGKRNDGEVYARLRRK
jgi:mRNA interferase RelE/StbE